MSRFKATTLRIFLIVEYLGRTVTGYNSSCHALIKIKNGLASIALRWIGVDSIKSRWIGIDSTTVDRCR